jgi:uncharacterized protein
LPEKPGSVAAILALHHHVAIDSNVLIYLLEGVGPRADAAAVVVDAVARGGTDGILASVAIAEILVPAATANDGVGFEEVAATLRDLGFRIIALDASVAEDVAWIRGRSGIPIADAIHLACARSAGATIFLTNDRRIPVLPQLEVAILDDLVA